MRKLLILALIALLLLALFFCLSRHIPAITADCENRARTILDDAGLSFATANVAKRTRDVTLTGTAPNAQSHSLAQELVSADECSHNVFNQLAIAPPPPPEISPYVTQIVKNDDNSITLSGHVPDEDGRNRLVRAAATVVGANKVSDKLNIGSGQPQDWQQSLIEVFGQVTDFDTVTATLTDNKLTIDGNVNSTVLRDNVTASFERGLPDSFTSIINIDAPEPEPEPISPYITRLTKNEDQSVTLSGHVPDDESKLWLTNRIATSVGKQNVNDQLLIAPGQSAPWKPTLGNVAKRMSEFETMSATLSDTELSITGTVDSGEKRDELTTAFQNTLSPTITPTFDIEAIAAGTPPPPQAPFETIYDYYGDRIVLGGYVPDNDAETWLVERANTHVGDTNVTETLELREDFPVGWKQAADALANNFKGYTRATGTVTEAQISIEGEATGIPERDHLQATISASLPPGYRATYSVSTPTTDAERIELDAAAVTCQVQINKLLSGQIVLFDFDSYKVKNESSKLMKSIVEVLDTCPNSKVTIMGRTDPSGSAKYNLKLSQQRADAIAAVLVEEGMNSERLSAIGYGESFPLTDDEKGLAQARSVEFVVTQ